jgi:mono/diheme cytochrome c family protein
MRSAQATTAVMLLLGSLALAAGCSARRSEPIAGPMNYTSPELRSGEISFDRHCSHCHPGGEKGLAPALNNKPLPGFLIKFQVRHGLGAMPAFSERELPAEELDRLVAYLKELRQNRP